jgi:molybdate transport system substrate-binding protein
VNITVLASNGVKEAVLELLPAFEHTSGSKAAITWGSTAGILEQVKGGAAFDLIILTAEAIDRMITEGKVAAGSRADLGASGIGLAVKSGTPKPDISTVDALKKALLAAKSVAHSRQGASGLYFPTVLARLGIADAMQPKIVIAQSSPVGVLIARGEAEIGVQQISELMPVAGIDIIGPLPGELQKMTVFSAGVSASAAQPDGARALIAALSAPDARPVFKRKGLEAV